MTRNRMQTIEIKVEELLACLFVNVNSGDYQSTDEHFRVSLIP
jgi:hypothetical protein